MPRSHKAAQNGILTVHDLVKLLGYSPPTIRRWIDKGEFAGSFIIPETRERRVPAPSVLAYLEKNAMPIPKGLPDYVAAFRKAHEPKAGKK